ncbi:hypothetical protein F4860DRAFT_209787 [Xylaria cubensis]|nr:hypothetical protein F4860DRAFT_209787 [Xylaria cubensis]
MSWVTSLKAAGALGLSTLQLLARLLYVLLTPILWCLQYFYASIVFLLSPIRVILSLGLGTVSFIINLITRLKYLYIYVSYLINVTCLSFFTVGLPPFGIINTTNKCFTQKACLRYNYRNLRRLYAARHVELPLCSLRHGHGVRATEMEGSATSEIFIYIPLLGREGG